MTAALFLVGIMSLAAACAPLAAPVATPVPAEEPQAAPAEEVEVRHMIWDLKQEDAVRQQIAMFEEENPNITIKLEIVPRGQYDDKLQTALAGGTAPDTFWLAMGLFLNLADRGALLDITPFIEANPEVQADADMLLPNLREYYTVDGKMYGFPRDFDTVAVIYNKNLFDEAGLAYPSEDWTWDDFRELSQKLTKQEGGRTVVFGADMRPSFQQVWGDFLYSNGGQILSEDFSRCALTEPEAVEAFEFVTGFPQEGLSPDAAALETMSHVDMFLNGRVAMKPAGDWYLSRFVKDVKDFEWDVAPLPLAPKTGERVSVIHGLIDTVNKDTEHPEEAFKWVSFLLRQEASAVLGETLTVIPSRKDTVQTFFAPEFPPPGRHYYMDIAPTAQTWPYTRKVAQSEISKSINDVAPLMWEGKLSVSEGLAQACERIDELLAEAGK